MHADDLDLAYTALCHALARVGEPQAPLLLAMLCLALMARQSSASEVTALIGRTEAACTR